MNTKFYCPITDCDYEIAQILIIRGSMRISVIMEPRFDNSINEVYFHIDDIESFRNIFPSDFINYIIGVSQKYERLIEYL